MKKITAYTKMIAAAAFIALMSVAGCTEAPLEKTTVDDSEFGRLLTPVGLKIATEGIGTDYANVTWGSPASLFSLEYTTDENFETGIQAIADIETNKFKVEGLDEATRYYLRVRAISDRIDIESSHYSDTISLTTLSEPHLTITVEDVMNYDETGTSTIMTIKWGEMPGGVIDDITFVILEFAAGEDGRLIFPVSPAESAARTKVVTEGVGQDILYRVYVMRGDKVRAFKDHTTKPGPIPTVAAAGSLDLAMDPPAVVVTLTWEMYAVTNLAKATFTKEGAPSPALTVTFTPAELSAKTAVVNSGLTEKTTYTVQLIDSDDQPIASAVTTVTTPELPSGDYVIVRPNPEETDPAQQFAGAPNLFSLLLSADRPETIYLLPGTYKVTSDNRSGTSTFLIKKNLELIGADPKNTIIDLGGLSMLSSQGLNIDKVIMSNVTITSTGTQYIFCNNLSSGNFNLGLLHYDNCHFLLGDSSRPSVFSMFTGAGTGRVGEIRITNVLFYGSNNKNGDGLFDAAYAFIHNTATSANSIDRITIENSTLSGLCRGILNYAAGAAPAGGISNCHITLANSTFHNYGSNATSYFIHLAVTDFNNSSISVTNCILTDHVRSAPRMWRLDDGGTTGTATAITAAKAEDNITLTNMWYYANGIVPGNASSAYNLLTPKMFQYPGLPGLPASSIFENPKDNPADPAASFKIKTTGLTPTQISDLSKVGDPRWR